MNKYGLRLKELREKNGYTQETLAKKLNTSRSRIGMYEQGKRQPDFEMQEAIADLFNVSIDYLFGRKTSNTTDMINDIIKSEVYGMEYTPDNFDNYSENTALIIKARKFSELYYKATPEIRAAVDILLKSSQPSPESQEKP